MDSYSSVELSAPFEPERKAFRELFVPFTFKPMEVLVGGERLFRGIVVGISPEHDVERSIVSVSAYALPGVLQDCTAPASVLPTEYRNLTLSEIAKAVAKPFGLEVVLIGPAAERPFDRVKLKVGSTVHEFLVKLAQQRNLVITSTADGAVLCWQSEDPGTPVEHLRSDRQPVTAVAASFDPQQYYSEITGHTRPKKKKAIGFKHTEKNPFLLDVLRPTSVWLDDAETSSTPGAVRAKLGRMFANMCSFGVKLATWRTRSGELWTPNTTITLRAPEAMVYEDYEFLIRTVDLHQDDDETTAELGLVLPGAFSGQVPEELPWAP